MRPYTLFVSQYESAAVYLNGSAEKCKFIGATLATGQIDKINVVHGLRYLA
jgi:hypothetical protein